MNSCDDTLRDKLIESTRGWSPLHKGGPTYLKLLMNLIVATSKKSLRSLLNKVSSLKLSDFDGEDVNKAVSFLRGAVLILKDNDALPSDFLTLVINIFKQTSCATFASYVTTIEHNVDLEIAKFDTEGLLSLFEKKYIDMIGRSEWTPKSTAVDQQSSFYSTASNLSIMCFNCGGIGHTVSECKQPLDANAIEIRKNIIFNKDKKKSSGSPSAGQAGSRSDGHNNNGGGGNRSNDNSGASSSPRALKVPPRKGESHEKTINGTKMYWCGKPGCCKWGDHKSAGHPSDDGQANPQGLLADDASSGTSEHADIGDDSSSRQETGTYTAVSGGGFLTSSSLTGF